MLDRRFTERWHPFYRGRSAVEATELGMRRSALGWPDSLDEAAGLDAPLGQQVCPGGRPNPGVQPLRVEYVTKSRSGPATTPAIFISKFDWLWDLWIQRQIQKNQWLGWCRFKITGNQHSCHPLKRTKYPFRNLQWPLGLFVALSSHSLSIWTEPVGRERCSKARF
jgi:hypothetical protein